MLRKLPKTLKRTVVVESVYLGRPKLAVLRELVESYREMIREAVDHAVENSVKSLAKLRMALYQEAPRKVPRDAREAR